jgi:hypothetical protein
MSIQTIISKAVDSQKQTYETQCDLRSGSEKTKYAKAIGGCRAIGDEAARKVRNTVDDKCESQKLGHGNLLNVDCDEASKEAKDKFYQVIGRKR